MQFQQCSLRLNKHCWLVLKSAARSCTSFSRLHLLFWRSFARGSHRKFAMSCEHFVGWVLSSLCFSNATNSHDFWSQNQVCECCKSCHTLSQHAYMLSILLVMLRCLATVWTAQFCQVAEISNTSRGSSITSASRGLRSLKALCVCELKGRKFASYVCRVTSLQIVILDKYTGIWASSTVHVVLYWRPLKMTHKSCKCWIFCHWHNLTGKTSWTRCKEEQGRQPAMSY